MKRPDKNGKLSSLKSVDKNLPALRREFLDNAEKHRVRANKKTLLKEQADYESSNEIQEYLNGTDKI